MTTRGIIFPRNINMPIFSIRIQNSLREKWMEHIIAIMSNGLLSSNGQRQLLNSYITASIYAKMDV